MIDNALRDLAECEQTLVPERQVESPASGEVCEYEKPRVYPTYTEAPSHNLAPSVAPQKAQKKDQKTPQEVRDGTPS